ncbi:mitomycin resistance protein [Cyanobium sp. PCC 7001]|uniref:helix-hairpin-helix domain-containing protein n=1 Tax=Cyanobium sp. PCC 7001 TaxID=180281 RepID=UPI00018056A7|nr:helix-hairpin-helix domain-containing protein [Cyanobium sp. PCC 7001]EDY38599.1 mitomycin resistance protein [Cyanobium sp. PCC 7001]
MHPSRCNHESLAALTDLPNVGPAIAKALLSLGYRVPADLNGADPLDLYNRLGDLRGCRQDPCVLDVFIAITRFLNGEPARPWWAYSEDRRRRHPDL